MHRQASMTVEASLITPIIIYCMLFFLNFFQVLFFHQKMQMAMNETARYFSKNTRFIEQIVGDIEVKDTEKYGEIAQIVQLPQLASSVVYKTKLLSELSHMGLDISKVVHKENGIQVVAESDVLFDDCIDFSTIYEIRMDVPLFAKKSFSCVQRVHQICWTGREVERRYREVDQISEEEEENEEVEYVYITEEGKRYHLYEDCTYLDLSIQETRLGEVATLRNQYRRKYQPCHLCIKKTEITGEKIYITRQGERYHFDRLCSGLKRTVKTVEKETVEGKMECCHRCNKRGEKHD